MKKNIALLLFAIIFCSMITGCSYETKEQLIENNHEELTLEEKMHKYLGSTIGNFGETINITENESGLYDISIEYNRTTVYLHICGQDAQSYVKTLISSNDSLNEEISNVHVICNENNEVKYNVYISDFSEITEDNIDNYTMLMDKDNEKLNTTVQQATSDYIKADKKNYKVYAYKTIFRYPDDYKGKLAKFTGQVVQVIENYDEETYDSYSYRVNVTKDNWGFYDDTVYVTFFSTDKTKPRILEDDIVTVYGKLEDLKTYETIFGESVTIPSISADYIDIN